MAEKEIAAQWQRDPKSGGAGDTPLPRTQCITWSEVPVGSFPN